MARRPCVVLGVTVPVSLTLMNGFPELLAAKGWDVHVVSSPGRMLDALGDLPHLTAHELVMSRGPSAFLDFRSLVAWVRLLSKIRPDIVFIGTPKAGLLGMISARIVGVPSRVYLLRGLRLETSSGVGRRLLVALEKLTMKCATHVLSVGPTLTQRALDLRLAPQEKIRVLGWGSSNGVDTVEYDRSRFTRAAVEGLRDRIGLHSDLPTIGFVGRLTRDKGLFDLASALEVLGGRGVACQVLIVGAIDDSSGREALKKLEALDMPVVVVGYVAEPAQYYPLMDVFCLPSHREGFANVVLEASAMNVPVVVTDATGVADTIDDGRTGLSTPVRNPSLLASNLERVLEDPLIAARMGSAGRRWVLSRFERSEVQLRYATDLQNTLITGKTRRGHSELVWNEVATGDPQGEKDALEQRSRLSKASGTSED